jgi:hypothetical protein
MIADDTSAHSGHSSYSVNRSARAEAARQRFLGKVSEERARLGLDA